MAHTSLFRGLILALQRARRANLQAAGQPEPITRAQAGATRRRFIQTAALTSAAGALPLPLQAWAARGAGPAPRVAIVGGGLAGLNAAYQLQKVGIRATIYEAGQRVGGRILSVSGAIGARLVTDLGAELINTDHDDVLALVQDFGIELFNRVQDAERFALPKTGYFFDGAARSEAEVADDLRAFAAQIASDSALLDADYERFAPEFDQLSVKDYLDRHAGLIRQPYIRTLMESSIRTEYGVEPAESSALQLIGNLATVDGQAVEVLGYSDEVFSVTGGTGQIINGLAQQLRGQIQTSMPLTRIEARDDGFLLHFATADTVAADFVIVTIPFPVLRDVALDVPLPGLLRHFIDEFELGRNEKLIAGFSQRAWRQPQGFVGEAWTDLGYSEVWDETQRQPEREDGALTYFLGGREVTELGQESARAIGRSFVRRHDRITPGLKAASTDQFLRTRWSQSPYTRGGYANFKPGQLTRFGSLLWVESDNVAERQEVHAGNLIFAGEHLSDAFYGFMNGAAETGRLAADVVARRIAELSHSAAPATDAHQSPRRRRNKARQHGS